MKILHVLHAYPPAIGGVQQLFQNVSERLARDFGDQVTVYTTTAYQNTLFWDPGQPALPAGEEMRAGVRVRRFPVWNRWPGLRLNAARIAHKLQLPGEDWLRGLYFGPLAPGLARAVAAAAADADIVVASAFPLLHMHAALRGARRGGAPVIFVGALHPADRWCFDRPMIYRAIRRADAYIALSDFERAHLLRQTAAPQGDPDRIAVIGGGVDRAAFAGAREKRAAMRQRLGWSPDDPAVIFLGRHVEHKRIDVLIAAMRLVWAEQPLARLLIAGARTDYTPQLMAQVAALPEEQRTRITWVADFEEAEKPALLAACDVLANPSAYESFGIVFLEAWAVGVPVIGARVGAIPTIIEAGQDGLLAEHGDAEAWAHALLRLLGSPSLRARMGAAGREKVRARYDWPVVVRRFRETYARVLEDAHG